MKEPVITSGARKVRDILLWRPVSAVLSIESRPFNAPRIAGHGFGHIPQKILSFGDVEIRKAPNGQPLSHAPTLAKVEEGLSFIFRHAARGGDAVLVHCAAGTSRSPAMALGALALLHPGRDEAALVGQLLRVAPGASPNILVTEQADILAGRGGRLVEAVLDIIPHPHVGRIKKNCRPQYGT